MMLQLGFIYIFRSLSWSEI